MTSRCTIRAPRVSSDWHRGSTLLELVVALSLLALALGGIYGFVATGGRSARVTNSFLQSQAQVRAALDNVVDELRWAESICAAAASSVTALVPQNTPFSTGSPYTVTFAYDPNARALTRQVDLLARCPQPAGAPEAVAYDVVQEDGGAGLTFEYFAGDGTALGSNPADLTAITRLRLTVSTTRDQVSRTFAGDVAVRGR